MQSDGGVAAVVSGECLEILAGGGVGAVVPAVGVAGGGFEGFGDGGIDGKVESGEFTGWGLLQGRVRIICIYARFGVSCAIPDVAVASGDSDRFLDGG